MKGAWIWGIVVVCVVILIINRRRLGFQFFAGGPGGVTEVVRCDQDFIDNKLPAMRNSIAAVSMSSGRMYLNLPMIAKLGLSNEEVLFIMLHENAHMTLNSDNEEEVDALAHKQYMDLGYSLRKSVTALTRVLRFDKMEDLRRANAQLQRAKAYDYEHNN